MTRLYIIGLFLIMTACSSAAVPQQAEEVQTPSPQPENHDPGAANPDRVEVWKDPQTGCWYVVANLGYTGAAITPRNDRPDHQMCDGKP